MKGKDITYGIYKCEKGFLWMFNSHDELNTFVHPFCIVFGGDDTSSVKDLCYFAAYTKPDFLVAFGEDDFERVL